MNTTSRLISILGVVAGVVGAVIANIGALGLPPSSIRATVTAIAGLLVAIIVALEHPTTKQAATRAPAAPTPPIPAATPTGGASLP